MAPQVALCSPGPPTQLCAEKKQKANLPSYEEAKALPPLTSKQPIVKPVDTEKKVQEQGVAAQDMVLDEGQPSFQLTKSMKKRKRILEAKRRKKEGAEGPLEKKPL